MRKVAIAIGSMTFALAITLSSVNAVLAGDLLSGTYLDPAMQRKDFLPHYFTNQIPEYRKTYNRPMYIPGYIAYKLEPSSQEAMAWQTNYCNGNYRNHAGRYVPQFNYPKPWEALNTRARPDTHRVDPMQTETR